MIKMSAAALLFAGLIATPAIAAQDQSGGAPSARVRYSDLNLGTEAGRQALASRVRSAAARMCKSGSVEPIGVRMAQQACYRTAISSAQGQVRQAIADFGTTRLAGRGSVTLTLSQ